MGRTILANTIYDPLTRHAAPNGQIVTDPFTGNRIDPTRFDLVTQKIQNLIPLPLCTAGPPCNATGVVGNYQNSEAVKRDTEAPSLKVDHSFGSRDKLSFFWSRTMTFTATGYGEDGAPQPISGTFGGGIYSHRERLNYDHTISPTMLLHLGAGFDTDYLGRPSVTPDYDPCAGIGLCSQAFQRPATFPRLTGLSDTVAGGTSIGGPPGRADNVYSIVDSIASLTWVKGNHTFKFGGNGEFQGSYTVSVNNLSGTYGFSSGQTALPYVVNTSSGSSTANIGANHVGFPYASFLLGAVDTAEVDPPSNVRFGKQQWGFYAQDSWKVTRKLTLDLGLRYDYSTYYKEQYGRSPNLAPYLANPAAGGHPGAVIYQATCGCEFAKNYPWGFGPRIGFAYQALPKTVLRGGFGVAYTGTGVGQVFGAASGGASASNRFAPASVPGAALMTLGQGVTLNGSPLTAQQIAWPNFSTGFYPLGGVIPNTGPQYYDQNAGRPARQYQWSISVQREVARDLVVQASYIGNRGIWWPTYAGQPLTNYNFLSSDILSHYGLNLNNPADLATLLAPIGSAAAGRFQNQLPFAGFPLSGTVAQSLRPLPQFTTISLVNPPLGGTWYNSLQLTANKRFSHGLQFDFGFTWSKSLGHLPGNPGRREPGFGQGTFQFGPAAGDPRRLHLHLAQVGTQGRVLRRPRLDVQRISVLREWDAPGGSHGEYHRLRQQSLPGHHRQSHVSGGREGSPDGPAALPQNLDCHCFDPNTAFVLNPAAWANPAPGQFGTQTYYGDFRGERRPVENLSRWAAIPNPRGDAPERPGGVHQRVQPHVFERPQSGESPEGAGLHAADRQERRLLSAWIADRLRVRIDQHHDRALPATDGPARRAIPVLTESAPQ